MTAVPVLFTTNYPMAEARRLWRAGTYSAYHLFGTVHLERAGWPVEDLSPVPTEGGRVRHALRGRFGGLAAQRAVLRRRATSHVAYAADPQAYAGLALLRSAGLWRHPVVCVVHPELAVMQHAMRALRSYDVVIALSKRIHHELVHDVGRSPARTLWAPPGPDIATPLYTRSGRDVVVSTGRTYRDQATLLAALSAEGLAARVHTDAQSTTTTEGRVELVGRAPYAEVVADVQRASVAAIPLSRPTGTYGITELNDSLGMGTPILQTRNPYLDVDLDAVGCGFLLDEGDVDGWRRALRQLADDPEAAAEMGRAGRHFAETSWNWDYFAAAVREAMELVTR